MSLTIEVGDLVGCQGRDWLSNAIRAATGNDPLNHIGVVIATAPTISVVEALTHVVINSLQDIVKREAFVWILKPPLTSEQRDRIPMEAASMVGQGYNYGDILLQGLDSIFRTRWFTHHLAISQFGPICSWLAGKLEPWDLPLSPQDASPNDFWRQAVAKKWPIEIQT